MGNVLLIISLMFAIFDIQPMPVTVGVATYYTYEMYGEGHLYCSGQVPGLDLRYTPELMDAYDWVAIDVRLYLNGSVSCDDTLRVVFDNGKALDVKAWDAGPFEKYWVEPWSDLPILVDFEESAWPHSLTIRSGVVGVMNLTTGDEVDVE